MIRYVKRLALVCLTPEMHANTCGYWYCVQSEGMAHTAFATFEGLSKWMAERGLNFSQELPPAKTHQYQALVGEYTDVCHMSYDEFYALEGHRTKVLSNADYTMGIVTVDDNGQRVVNYLNPNCKDRVVYDYQTSRKEMS